MLGLGSPQMSRGCGLIFHGPGLELPAVPHAHRTARYMQLLRKNQSLPFPAFDEG